MLLNLIQWKKSDKFIFAGVVLFGLLNLGVSLLIILGVSW